MSAGFPLDRCSLWSPVSKQSESIQTCISIGLSLSKHYRTWLEFCGGCCTVGGCAVVYLVSACDAAKVQSDQGSIMSKLTPRMVTCMYVLDMQQPSDPVPLTAMLIADLTLSMSSW